MEKVYVKLRDRGSICNDFEQGVKIVGIKPVEVLKTAFIQRALNSGVLVKLTKDDFNREVKAYDEAKAKAVEAERAAIEKKTGVKLEVVADIKPPKESTGGKLTGSAAKTAAEDTEKAKNLDVNAENVGAAATDTEGDKANTGDADAGAEGDAEGGKEDEGDVNEGSDYSMWVNEDLVAELKKREIDFTGAKKKADYIALLVMDDDK